jgi:hypothetical protein
MNSTSGLTAWASPSAWLPKPAGAGSACLELQFFASDATLADLQRLSREGVIRRYLVIERGGVRFGIFGLLGKEAQFYTGGAGAAAFSDAIETGKEMVKLLRETEKVDVVIALSHGGVQKEGRAFHRATTCAWPKRPGIDADRRPQPHRSTSRRTGSPWTAAR